MELAGVVDADISEENCQLHRMPTDGKLTFSGGNSAEGHRPFDPGFLPVNLP